MRRSSLTRWAPVFAAFWLWAGVGFWDFLFDRAHDGNQAFAKGEYDQAVKEYSEAQLKSPDEPVLDFNLAGALYKQDQYDDAATAWRKSYTSQDPQVVADSHYNAGNALFKKGQYQEAIQEYIETLKRRPDDEDAKYNLELARRLLQQREPQQDPPNDPKQNEDQKDDQGGAGGESGPEGEDGESKDKADSPEKGEKGKKDPHEAEKTDEKPNPGKEPAEEQDEKSEDEEQTDIEETKDVQDPNASPYESLTPEQAARILDSLKKDEQDELIRQILPKTGYTDPEKYW